MPDFDIPPGDSEREEEASGFCHYCGHELSPVWSAFGTDTLHRVFPAHEH